MMDPIMRQAIQSARRRSTVLDSLIVTPAHLRKGIDAALVLEAHEGLVATGLPQFGSLSGGSMTATSGSMQIWATR